MLSGKGISCDRPSNPFRSLHSAGSWRCVEARHGHREPHRRGLGRRGIDGRGARRRRPGHQGNARSGDPRVPIDHHPQPGRLRGAEEEEGRREPGSALRQSAGPLHRPRARADRPAARRLAGAQGRDPVRTAAPPRPGRGAGGVGHRPTARYPEGRDPGGAEPRPERPRTDPHVLQPGRAGHRPAAQGFPPGRDAQPRQGRFCARRRTRQPGSRARLPAGRRGRGLDRAGPLMVGEGLAPARSGRRRPGHRPAARHGPADRRAAAGRNPRLEVRARQHHRPGLGPGRPAGGDDPAGGLRHGRRPDPRRAVRRPDHAAAVGGRDAALQVAGRRGLRQRPRRHRKAGGARAAWSTAAAPVRRVR